MENKTAIAQRTDTHVGLLPQQRAESPYPLASRERQPAPTNIPVLGQLFGGNAVQMIAGPCSVESRAQILEIAHAVKEAGAVALRGGAYKPRTSPYSFQGHEEKALEWLAEAREQTGLAIVTEVMDQTKIAQVAEVADVLQVGSRNMHNFALLRDVGCTNTPVLLKRGMSSTIKEFLLAAEYIMSQGNKQVMLCERGIRTFSQETRNTFDINAIPALKQLTHLPVIADPSHGTGKHEYVESVAMAAIAAGADGLLIEVHPRPTEALSDGRQSLTPEAFARLVQRVQRIALAVDRPVGTLQGEPLP
jgi:3-deoxy-7-phosphoheptulonate synthase